MNKIYIKILPVLFLIIFMTSIAMSQNTNEIKKREQQQMNTDYIEVSLNYDVLKQLGYEKQDFIATDDGESFFLLTKAGETVKFLDIPSTYEFEGKKYKITQIESKIFESFSSLTNITIPNSVTKIGNRAFNHCTSLKKITLPDTIDEIPESAFSECFSLKSISLPKNIKKIGETSFCNCKSLEDIEIPNGVTEIGFLAFSGCTSLKELKIPNSVTEIGFKAFENVPHVYYKGKAKDPEKKAIFFRGIWGAKKFN